MVRIPLAHKVRSMPPFDPAKAREQAWLRRYFVPVQQRFQNWHPIVLEEMALNDFEAQRERQMAEVAGRDVVCMTELSAEWPGAQHQALPPTETGPLRNRQRLDRPQNPIGGPKFYTRPAPEPLAVQEWSHSTELYLG